MSATAQNFVYRCDAKYMEAMSKPTITREEMDRCVKVATRYYSEKDILNNAKKNNE